MFDACSLDIETSHLDADFGVILVAVIKPAGKKPVVFRLDQLSKNWDSKRSDDRPVLSALVRELSKYDIVVAHNGTRFDIPFIRARMLKWRMGTLKNFKLVDPCSLSRNKLKLSGNSLNKVTAFAGFNSKSEVHGDLWVAAALDGDRRAMNYIVKHCVQDVIMLESWVELVKDYISVLNGWGSCY